MLLRIRKKTLITHGLLLFSAIMCWGDLYELDRPWQISISFSLVLLILSLSYLRNNRICLSLAQRKLLHIAKLALGGCGFFLLYFATESIAAGSLRLHTITRIFSKVWPYVQPPLFVVVGMAVFVSSKHRIFEKQLVRVLSIFLFATFLKMFSMGTSVSGMRNAFWAFVAILLMSFNLHKVLKNVKANLLSNIFMICISVILFSFPFFASLRGASGIALIVLLLISIPMRKGSTTSVLLIAIVFPIVLSVLSSEYFLSSFREQDIHRYTNPTQVLTQGYTLNERNAEARMEWWSEAFGTFLSKPLFGTMFKYRFTPWGLYIGERSAGSLHNYYMSMFVDGGLLLIVPCIGMVIYGMYIGCINYIKRTVDNRLELSWAIASIMTLFTNTYGHIPYSSGILAMILGFSLCKLTASSKSASFSSINQHTMN